MMKRVQSVKVDGTANDGKFCWLNSGPVEKSVLDKACKVNGLPGMAPNKETRMKSLEWVLNELVTRLDVKQWGNQIKPSRLAKDQAGWEYRREIKGEKQNDHQFLFSANLAPDSKGDDTVRLLEVDTDHVPEWLTDHHQQIERGLTDLYRQRELVYPTAYASAHLSEVFVRQMGAIRVKGNGGGVFFIPRQHIETLDAMADELDRNTVTNGSGGKLDIIGWSVVLSDEPRAYRNVFESFGRHLKEQMQALRDEVANLKYKPRKDGKARRLEAIEEMKKQIEIYSELLRDPLTDLQTLATETEEYVDQAVVQAVMA